MTGGQAQAHEAQARETEARETEAREAQAREAQAQATQARESQAREAEALAAQAPAAQAGFAPQRGAEAREAQAQAAGGGQAAGRGHAAPRPAGEGGSGRRWAHRLGAALLALPLLAGLALGALAWRLAQGPLQLPPLARAIESRSPPEGPRIEVGRASIAWEGWRGGAAPLDLRLEGVRLLGADGAPVATLPDAAVALALRPLLRGEISPGAIVLRAPRLALERGADGALSLAGIAAGGEGAGLAELLKELLRPPGEGRLPALRRLAIEAGEVTLHDAALDVVWTITGIGAEAHRLPEGGVAAEGVGVLGVGSATIPVRLAAEAAGGAVRVRLDLPALRTAELARALPPLAPLAQLDATAELRATGEFGLDGTPRDLRLAVASRGGGALRPRPGLVIPFAGLEAELSAAPQALVLRRARLAWEGGAALVAEGRLEPASEGWRGALDLALEGFGMAGLAQHWPEALAPTTRRATLALLPAGELREARARVDLAADADLGDWRALSARLVATVERAALRLPGAPRPIDVARVEAAATLAPDALRLEGATLLLSPPGAPAPTSIRLAGQAARGASGWEGTGEAAVDRLRFADLAFLWPEGVGDDARRWMTENVTAGEARAGQWRAAFTAGPDFGAPRLLSLTGTARAEGATVHWLRPIPPARGVSAEAVFSKEELVVRTVGGRQEDGAGRATGLEARSGSLRIQFAPEGVPDPLEMEFRLAGPATEIVEVLKHPRLRLFDRRPFPVRVAAGQVEGRFTLAFPLAQQIPLDALRLRAEARVSGGRLTEAVLGRDLEALALDLTADTQALRIGGTGQLGGIALRLQVEADLRAGPQGAVVSRETVSARADVARLAALGFDVGGFARGPIPLEIRAEQRRGGASSVSLRADLREAALAVAPLRWAKPSGAPAQAEAMLRLQDDRLLGIDGIRVEAPDLALRGRAVARAGRVERIEIAESTLAGSRFGGEARPPEQPGAPWQVTLRGPTLDLRALLADRSPAAAPDDDGAPVRLDAGFDRVLLGEGRELFAVQARARADGRGVVQEATLRARTARGGAGVEASLAPQPGGARRLRLEAGDGGALLRAFGLTSGIDGGSLTLDAAYAGSEPGAALSGVAELGNFVALDAPALGKLLQAVTLYGVVEALQGGRGLSFSRAVVPFVLTPAELRLDNARAFSASLGLTARGRVELGRTVLDLEGTIVPAYVFNSFLGNLPLVGRLFSAERGGGLFAATFRIQGVPEEAVVTVNPLAALTPGFLRGLFGGAEGAAPSTGR